MVSQSFRSNYAAIDWNARIDIIPRAKQYAGDKRSALPTPMIARDYRPYECPITGKMIEGRAAHAENLKRHGCRILETGEFEDVKKNGKKRLEEKIDAAIDKSIEAVAKDFT